ncbi:MAG: hypothetical protein AB7V62_03850 [Thermoleophilia bacterium]
MDLSDRGELEIGPGSPIRDPARVNSVLVDAVSLALADVEDRTGARVTEGVDVVPEAFGDAAEEARRPGIV